MEIFDSNFGVIDAVIVAIVVVGVTALGVYTNRFIGSLKGYLVAGRSVRPALNIATMMATEMGLVTFAYASQKGFTTGFSAFHIAVIMLLMCMLIGVTGFIVYRLRKAEVMTIPEYYEQRYGRKTRALGGILLVSGGVLNMGLFLLVEAQVIGGLLGLHAEWQIETIMVVLLLIVFTYTLLGGMVSVVVTDWLQAVLITVSIALVTYFCLRDVGGWDGAVAIASEHWEEDQGFNPLANPNFGFLYIAWMMFNRFITLALWQPATVRALIAQDPKGAKIAYFWGSLGFLNRFMFPYFWGICAVGAVMANPEWREMFFPIDPTTSIMATPTYIAELVPPVILGIVISGFVLASLSTYDSYFMCWSASIVQDIIAPIRGKELSDKARIRLTRICIVLVGLYMLAWGLFYQLDGDVWEYLAITGAIYTTGAVAVVAGGLYWKRASSTGAVIAMLMGGLSVAAIVPSIVNPIAEFMAAEGTKAWQLEPWMTTFGGKVSENVVDGETVRTVEGGVNLLGNAFVGLATTALAVGGMIVGSLLWPDRPKPAATPSPTGDSPRT